MSFFVEPNFPQQLEQCTASLNKSETEVCVKWKKPNGGEAIDYYVIKWKLVNKTAKKRAISSIFGQIFYSYVLTELSPGSNVSVSVNANNSVGEGGKLSSKFTTREFHLDYELNLITLFVNCTTQLFVNPYCMNF